MTPHRRHVLAALAAMPFAPSAAFARATEIGWEDLIPKGVPYPEIVAQGEMDEVNDRWLPIFDVNAYRFAEALDGTDIRIPGFVLPLETGAGGVSEFILTPYAGACVHVPPPPPNQLIFVTTATPWPAKTLFEPVWVTGRIGVNPIETSLAEIGYELSADLVEPYEWSAPG